MSRQDRFVFVEVRLGLRQFRRLAGRESTGEHSQYAQDRIQCRKTPADPLRYGAADGTDPVIT